VPENRLSRSYRDRVFVVNPDYFAGEFTEILTLEIGGRVLSPSVVLIKFPISCNMTELCDCQGCCAGHDNKISIAMAEKYRAEPFIMSAMPSLMFLSIGAKSIPITRKLYGIQFC
jgi:hypothetical protein